MVTTVSRIQRRRTAGWRKPVNAIDVTRSGRWGNLFVPGEHCTVSFEIDYNGARRTITAYVRDAAHAVQLHERMLKQSPVLVQRARLELRRRTLMCWCPPGDPCHADTLIRAANSDGDDW